MKFSELFIGDTGSFAVWVWNIDSIAQRNDKLFGVYLMTVGGDEQVIFKTSNNTYEYAEHVHDYYLKNGEESVLLFGRF